MFMRMSIESGVVPRVCNCIERGKHHGRSFLGVFRDSVLLRIVTFLSTRRKITLLLDLDRDCEGPVETAYLHPKQQSYVTSHHSSLTHSPTRCKRNGPRRAGHRMVGLCNEASGNDPRQGSSSSCINPSACINDAGEAVVRSWVG